MAVVEEDGGRVRVMQECRDQNGENSARLALCVCVSLSFSLSLSTHIINALALLRVCVWGVEWKCVCIGGGVEPHANRQLLIKTKAGNRVHESKCDVAEHSNII